MPTYTLNLLDETLAVCRLAPGAPFPKWARSSDLLALVRTADELSVVCEQAHVPPGVLVESNWRALKVRGPLDFSLVGVLAELATILAAAGVSIFAISTYETDYLLVCQVDLAVAVEALRAAGMQVVV